MKVILVDDEPAMHLILSKMLSKLPGVQVAGTFTDTESAFSFLRQNADIELAFVDISMPGESGLDFATKLAADASLQVVFVTSHKEFALDAYELSVMDYLVKPVSQERLQQTIHRALVNRRWADSPQLKIPTDAPASDKIVITTLGDITVRSKSGRVKWISRKCAELFAYLLLYRDRRVPRSSLVKDIFGGMHQVNAENYLNTTVYQLRKSLEPLGLKEIVRSENDGYALELKDAVIDHVEFKAQVDQLKLIEAGNVESALQIERSYTGDLFGDKAYVWSIHETERFAEMYTSLVKRLAVFLMDSGNAAAASKLLLKLNERNPLDESVIRELMSIHGMAGDKKGLAALYADYVRLLSRELSIGPSEEIVRHYGTLINRFTGKK